MEAQKPKQVQSQQVANEQLSNNGIPKGGWWFVAIFAALVFIGFGILIRYMAVHAVTSDVADPENKIEWDHLVFLFNNIQTFVFAAGTFIFGREINRSSANASTQRANDAEKQKAVLEKMALEKEAEVKKQLDRGQTIANMLRSQLTQNRFMGIKLGTIKTDDDSPEMNGFIELLNEWYPKK